MGKKQIIYNIGFNVNNSNLKNIEAELNRIANAASFKSLKFTADTSDVEAEFKNIRASANALGKALEDSYNPKIDSVNIQKFNKSLEDSGTSLKKVAADLQKVDDNGVQSFRNLTAELLTTKKEIKQTSKLLDSMATTFFNTVKWSISSSALNTFTGTIQKAWNYSQKLDASLNDIRIVTGKSNEEMEKFAKNANKAAKDLKAGTTNYTNAALIYYQQGLGEEEVAARAGVTVKAANVTGQSASKVSEQLTAVWNGYKVVAEEAELYVDKLAAVAATTAADLEELSTGMSKVASAANAMGVDVDQLSAQLATIVSVTRQDASVVGTALKTIYSRMGDLQVSGVDEFGTSLGDVSGKLKQMGIDVLDQEGNLRDMGNVIEEVAAKWGTWTGAQQQAAAVAIAGKRQYNNLIALFENWDMYESAKGTSQTSAGTLQKQQDIYADSLEAKLKGISTAAERVYDALFDSESMKDFLDDVAELVDKFGSFTEAIGGGGNLLGMLGSIGMRVFNEQITKGITNTITNLGIMKKNLDENRARLEILDEYKDILKDPQGKDKDTIEKMVKIREQELKYSKYLSEEEKKQLELNIKQTAEIANQKDEEAKRFKEAEEFYQKQFDAEVGDASRQRSGKKDGVQIDTRKKAAKQLRERADELVGFDEDEFSRLYKRREQKDKNGLLIDPKTISEENFKEIKQRQEILSQKEKLSKSERNELDLLKKKILAKEADIEIEKKIQELTITNSKLNSTAKNKLIELSKEGKVTEEKLIEILGEAADYYAIQADVIEKNADNVKKLDDAAENADRNNKKIFNAQNIKILTSEFVNLTSSIMGVVSGINMISNVSEIASDTSLSGAEKIEQGFQAVSTGIATITPGIMSSINAIKVGASGIQKAFGWISLVMMAVTAIVTISKEIYDNMDHRTELEKVQDDFDAATESAQKAREALTELRSEYNGLMSDIVKYREARIAIDDMRVGTEEWQAAVESLNQQVLSLLEKYPELKLKTENISGTTVYSIEDSENSFNSLASSYRSQIQMQQAISTTYAREAKEAEFILEKKRGFEKYDFAQPDEGILYISSVTDTGTEYNNTQLARQNNLSNSWSSVTGLSDFLLKKTQDSYYDTEIFGIDVSSLEKLTVEEIQKIIDTVQDGAVEEEDSLLKILNQAKENVKATQETRDEIKNLKKEEDISEGERLGVNGEVYEKLKSKDTPTIYLNADKYVTDGSKLKRVSDGTIIGNDLGGKNAVLNTKGDKEAALTWMMDLFQYAYEDDTIAFNQSTKEDLFNALQNVEAADLEKMTVDVIVNGKEKTLSVDQALKVVARRQQDEESAEYNTNLLTEMRDLKSKGRSEEAALYSSEVGKYRDGAYDKDTATMSSLSMFFNYDTEKYVAAENAKIALAKNIAKIITGSEESQIENLDAYGNLTEGEVQKLKNSIDAAALARDGGVIQELVDSITDPAQMAELQDLLSEVDWANADSVNQFRTGLIEAGIETDALGESWDNFINKVNSGMKQWISNAKKVGENLAYIRDTVEGIEIGSLISDEEYKKMIAINPDVAKYFVKTAGGMVAIANGKEIAGTLKTSYNDLGEIKSYYERITTAVGTVQGNSSLTNEILETDQSSVLNYVNQSKGNFKSVAKALDLAGSNNLDNIISKAESGDDAAIELLRGMVMAVNQARLDVANGEYDTAAAQQVYGTSVASSWTEANNVGTWADDETKRKVQNYWKNTYLSELGLSLSEELINGFDIGQLEDATKRIRKLELDYFKEFEKELAKLNVLTEKAFGADKQKYLENRISNEKGIASNANKIASDARDVFEFIVDSSGYGNLYNEGSGWLNTEVLNNRLTSLDPESAEYKNIQAILEMYDKVIDAEQKALEAGYAVIDAQIESFKYGYEAQKQINNSLRELRDFQTEFKDSLAEFGESELKANFENALNTLYDKAEDYALSINKIDKMGAAYGYSTNISALGQGIYIGDNPYAKAEYFDEAQYLEDWKTEIDSAAAALKEMQGSLETMYETYLSAQDELLKIYDKEIGKLEKINSILRGSADLAKMLGQSSSSYFEGIVNNTQNSYNLAFGQLDVLQSEYNKIFTNGVLNEGISQEMADKVTENLAIAGENVIKTAQNMYTAISDQFAYELQELFDKYSGISGMNLAAAAEDWSLTLEKENRYLDNVNEAYAVDQLNRNFEKSIDETDNIAAQNKLLEKQNQLQAKLAEIKATQGKLTQADLDRANAEYELTLKQIALEEAQQTANKMKLIRDASGNYSYQYVADQDAIAQAEEELAAAENNLYNMDKNRTQSLVSEYYSTMTTANQQIAEAMAAGDEERVERLRNYYFGEGGLISGIQKELGIASENLNDMGQSLMGTDWASNFAELSAAIVGLNLKELGGEGGGIAGLISTTSISMSTLESSLNTLLGEGGALATLPDKLADSLKSEAALEDNTIELANLTSAISTQLPSFVTAVNTLKNDFVSKWGSYNTYLEKNTTEIAGNTAAIKDLSDRIDAASTQLQNGIELKSSYGDSIGTIYLDTEKSNTGDQ